MDHAEFHTLISSYPSSGPQPVVLLEGTRELPDEDRPILKAVAAHLAVTYPQAVFRTGNATGSDEAFAEGIASVDPSRLQYVLPYRGHRSKAIDDRSYKIGLNELPKAAETRAAYVTREASPQYGGLIEKRDEVPRLKTKANYLIRDTVKVTGDPDAGLAPATCGLFYVNAADPMKGGTGHTVRVCLHNHVPTAFQMEWREWIADSNSSA